MSFFQSIRPSNTPSHIASQGELLILRERLLQTILLYLAGFGVITYVVALRDAVVYHEPQNAIAFTVIFLATVTLAVNRRIPYNIRASALLTVILGAGIWSLYEYGLAGNARLFLYTFAALTAVFLGFRSNVAGVIISVVALVFFAIAMTSGWIPVPALGDNADSGNTADWLLGITYFILLVFTATSSISILITGMENSHRRQMELSKELEQERAGLQSRIQTHTVDLERRLVQIRTAVDITRSMSTLLDPQALMQSVVDLLRDRMDLYYVGIFLFDQATNFAVLRAGTGEAGQKMIAAGHRLQVGGSSMIGWTLANRRPRIALDVGTEAIRFSNPYLPLTRSELAIPIQTTTKTLGALTIQSVQPSAFDENDILVFQGISDSLAIALENARLFQQNQQDLDEIRALNRQYLEKAWAEVSEMYGSLQFTFDNPQAQSSDANIAVSGQAIRVPIKLRDQEIGTISLETGNTTLSGEEQEIVEAITTQTALALESARLLEETQRRAAQEQKINQLSTKFSQAINIDEILKVALEELGQMPSVSEVSVHLMPVLDTETLPESPQTGNGHKSSLPGKNGKEQAQ